MVTWYLIPICILVGIGLGYGFRGFINREGKQLRNKVKI